MAVNAPELEAQLPADAAGLLDGSEEMAPIIMVGGVKSDITPPLLYAPLLAGRDQAGLSTRERFFPLLKGGLASFEDMYKYLEEGVEEVYEQEGERLVVASQSLGGLFSTELGVRRPDMVEAVICLAGAQAGVKGEKPAAKVLRYSLGNPGTAVNLQEDSELMIEHTERIASEWSPDLPVHLVSSTTDILIPIQQGLKLKLPDGQESEKRVVVPRFMPESWARRVFSIPVEAELIKNFFGMADHFNIALTPAVISYIRGVRREAAGNTATEAATIPIASDWREPLAAAA
jgi:hypothetical protein